MKQDKHTGRILPGKYYKYAHTPEYRIWRRMITRCHNPNDSGYYKYGARGIRVCIRWRRSFNAFLHDMGPRPPNKSIDRIDNDGHYTPSNCKWSTNKEQMQNTRRTILVLGRTLREWSDRTGILYKTLKTRYYRGYKQRYIITKENLHARKKSSNHFRERRKRES